jgi:ABC-type branched-subunit amino acid transport system ATPase component
VLDFRGGCLLAWSGSSKVRLHYRAKSLAKHRLLAERRRLELARSLETGPEVLLLDEVIAGLNPPEADELVAIIEIIKQELGLTLFLIEHVMKLISALRQREGALSATLSNHPLQPELPRWPSWGDRISTDAEPSS